MKMLTLIIFLTHSIVSAQVIANLDTNNILIGDHITLTVEGEINNGNDWPVFIDSIGNLELLSASKIDSTPTENGWKLKQDFILTQWDSGFYHIPSISVGNEKTVDFVVTVNTISLKENAEAKDIKGPIDAPVTFSEVFPYLLAAIVIGLMIYFLIINPLYLGKVHTLSLNQFTTVIFNDLARETGVRIIPKYKKRGKPIEDIASKLEVVLTPFEIALTQLEELKIKKKWQNGEIKAYYSDLSEIVRTYIEDELHTPAMEMLTDDIIDRLKTRKINTAQLSILLNTADMAKFAKAKPTDAENELAIKFAFKFIHQTKSQDNDE